MARSFLIVVVSGCVLLPLFGSAIFTESYCVNDKRVKDNQTWTYRDTEFV
jgi:hypothetical protein